VCLPYVELASSAGSHNPDGVGGRSWPVEPLPEGISNEGLRCRMVSARPRCISPNNSCPYLMGMHRWRIHEVLHWYNSFSSLSSTKVFARRARRWASALPRGSSPRRRNSRYGVHESHASVATPCPSSICMALGLLAGGASVSRAGLNVSFNTNEGL
jgi:hypothetical protein